MILSCVLLGSVGFFPCTGGADIIVMPLEELVRLSEVIAVGTARGQAYLSNERGDLTQTVVTFQIESFITEPLPQKEIFIRHAGGPYMRVEDEPEFDKGKKYLVFLVKGSSQGGNTKAMYTVAGRLQGAVPVAEDNMLEGFKFKGTIEEVAVEIREIIKDLKSERGS